MAFKVIRLEEKNQGKEYREEPNTKLWDTPTLREQVEEEGPQMEIAKE